MEIRIFLSAGYWLQWCKDLSDQHAGLHNSLTFEVKYYFFFDQSLVMNFSLPFDHVIMYHIIKYVILSIWGFVFLVFKDWLYFAKVEDSCWYGMELVSSFFSLLECAVDIFQGPEIFFVI